MYTTHFFTLHFRFQGDLVSIIARPYDPKNDTYGPHLLNISKKEALKVKVGTVLNFPQDGNKKYYVMDTNMYPARISDMTETDKLKQQVVFLKWETQKQPKSDIMRKLLKTSQEKYENMHKQNVKLAAQIQNLVEELTLTKKKNFVLQWEMQKLLMKSTKSDLTKDNSNEKIDSTSSKPAEESLANDKNDTSETDKEAKNEKAKNDQQKNKASSRLLEAIFKMPSESLKSNANDEDSEMSEVTKEATEKEPIEKNTVEVEKPSEEPKENVDITENVQASVENPVVEKETITNPQISTETEKETPVEKQNQNEGKKSQPSPKKTKSTEKPSKQLLGS